MRISAIPHEYYVRNSEEKKLMEDNNKTALEVLRRRGVTEIVKETIEDAFAVGYYEQKESNKTTIQNMVEGAFIDIVKQGRQDTILISRVDN